MQPKKLVCYYEIGNYYPITKSDFDILMRALTEFHKRNKPIILPNYIKLEYLDAFSIKKFVKTTAMKLKLRFGK